MDQIANVCSECYGEMQYTEEFEAITDEAVVDGIVQMGQLIKDSEEESNPLNEFATSLQMSEIERIKKYSSCDNLLQRFVMQKLLRLQLYVYSRNQALL